jgi:hypothetical protein
MRVLRFLLTTARGLWLLTLLLSAVGVYMEVFSGVAIIGTVVPTGIAPDWVFALYRVVGTLSGCVCLAAIILTIVRTTQFVVRRVPAVRG